MHLLEPKLYKYVSVQLLIKAKYLVEKLFTDKTNIAHIIIRYAQNLK